MAIASLTSASISMFGRSTGSMMGLLSIFSLTGAFVYLSYHKLRCDSLPVATYAFSLFLTYGHLEGAGLGCKNENAHCGNRSHNALATLHRGDAARSCGSNAAGVAVVTRLNLPGLAPGFAATVADVSPLNYGWA
jgi:hypothetical protein